jgi:hypothetical protein
MPPAASVASAIAGPFPIPIPALTDTLGNGKGVTAVDGIAASRGRDFKRTGHLTGLDAHRLEVGHDMIVERVAPTPFGEIRLGRARVELCDLRTVREEGDHAVRSGPSSEGAGVYRVRLGAECEARER